MIEEGDLDGWDRWGSFFYRISGGVGEALAWPYGLLAHRLVAPLDCCQNSRLRELGFRCLLGGWVAWGTVYAALHHLLVGATLGTLNKGFRALGHACQKREFLHLLGQVAESPFTAPPKLMVWNVHGSSIPYSEPGIAPWSERMEEIINTIQTESPDLVLLEEVFDPSFSEALFQRLQDRYAHFYTHLGPTLLGEESGCVVISKRPIAHFQSIPFEGTESGIRRGFALFELQQDGVPIVRIIAAELSPTDSTLREKQFAQILQTLSEQKNPLPTLFIGGGMLEPQETSRALSHSDQEGGDYISLFKRILYNENTLPVVEKDINLYECHRTPSFPPALVATFSGLLGDSLPAP